MFVVVFMFLIVVLAAAGGFAATKLIKGFPQITWVAPIGSLVIILIFGGWLWSKQQGLVSDRNSLEARLTAEYPDAQNYLSDCLVRTNQIAQVAQAKSAAFDKVMSDAIKGRYGDNLKPALPGQSNALISALKEAYPDVSSAVSAYNDVIATVNGCRVDFRDKQSKLLDELRSYKAWRGQFWQRQFGMETPSGNLEARIGTNTWHGRAAEDKMFAIVLTSGAKNAYNTGTIPDNTELFPTTKP